jgi:hypothetical protein
MLHLWRLIFLLDESGERGAAFFEKSCFLLPDPRGLIAMSKRA